MANLADASACPGARPQHHGALPTLQHNDLEGADAQHAAHVTNDLHGGTAAAAGSISMAVEIARRTPYDCCKQNPSMSPIVHPLYAPAAM